MPWRRGTRIAVTGLGAISPLGTNTSESWNNLIRGKTGISALDKSRLLGKVLPECFGYVGDLSTPLYNRLDPHSTLSKREHMRVGDVTTLAYAAANEAINDAGWAVKDEESAERCATIVGTGVGGFAEVERAAIKEMNSERMSPFTVPIVLSSSPAGFICAEYDFRAFNNTVITACASGATAIVEGVNQIHMNNADLVVCGGVEFSEFFVAIKGFDSMMALSRKHKPDKASRPWDRDRDGFVVAEGAGMLVLEDMEHARNRDARVYAEIIGTGVSADAYSLVAPEPHARGMISAMKKAAKEAGISPDQIDYINAHATSTPVGDTVETIGVRKFMGENTKINMSSTKSSTGHMLGAAGAIEVIFCIKAMNEGIMPPTLNLDHPIDEAKGMNLVPLEAQEHGNMEYVMTNSFGFGGSNACLILKKV